MKIEVRRKSNIEGKYGYKSLLIERERRMKTFYSIQTCQTAINFQEFFLQPIEVVARYFLSLGTTGLLQKPK